MRRFAVLSATPDATYAPFLPIAAATWRAIDHHPLCILVDPPGWQQPAMQSILQALGPAKIAYLSTSDVPDFKRSTISQCSRLVAAAISDPDDYLLTSDVDMLPLSRSWFHQQDASRDFHVIGIDTKISPTHLNMCYLGGLASAWRDALGIAGTELAPALRALLDGQKDYWGLDEEIATKRITKWHRWPLVEVIPRNLEALEGRIDRSAWNAPPSGSIIDCHCPRPFASNWPSISKLVDGRVDRAVMETLDAYARR